MKYGVLYNAFNLNLGDDIQAYAASRFLPAVDYLIDRETINTFKSKDNEPVAVIMNAWYMWEKWHWPPSKCIIPHMVSIHYADHNLANQWEGSPLQYEALEGLGGDYFRTYQPIGCRDYFTMEQLQKRGIEAYFSGCVTLTLPQMPKKQLEKEYICVVDCDVRVSQKIQEDLQDSGIEIKYVTHKRKERDPDRSWEERKKDVEELLTLYRNAKCVIANRLHCVLPCLAQGTPVLLVKVKTDDIRFSPYYDFLHWTTVKDFLKGNYDFNFLNPPENKPDYKEVREKLIESCTDFVNRMEKITGSTEELNRFTYTDAEIHEWQYKLMDLTLHKWLYMMRERDAERKETQIQNKNKQTALKKELKDVEKELADAKKQMKKDDEQRIRLEKENKNLQTIVNSKTVRWARKIRKLIKG